MSVLSRLRAPDGEKRSMGNVLTYFTFDGQSYPVFGVNQTLTGSEEKIENSFQGYVEGIYKRQGVVAACMVARRHVFAQPRYTFQEYENSRPGALFGNSTLSSLERPWPGGVTSDLNARMLDHADLAGNAYITRNRRGSLKILNPQWVTIIIGSENEIDDDILAHDIDAELVGYVYKPPRMKPRMLLPNEVAHFAPEPDPIAQYRGMSWLTPVLRNISSHTAATVHKQKFFTNGATPNLILSWDAAVGVDKLKAFKELFEEEYSGLANAYKTMFLGGGATATPVGQDFKQLDFKAIQGTDETTIAANAGVPPIIAGLSEGLEASTYSNYGQAKRQFADTTIYHLCQNAAASFETLVPPPNGSRLWFDMRDIPFFRDDAKSEADIKYRDSQTLRNFIDAGWDPETAKQAVMSGELSGLEHTGLFSVQLQRPDTQRSITVPIRAAAELIADGWVVVSTEQET